MTIKMTEAFRRNVKQMKVKEPFSNLTALQFNIRVFLIDGEKKLSSYKTIEKFSEA